MARKFARILVFRERSIHQLLGGKNSAALIEPPTSIHQLEITWLKYYHFAMVQLLNFYEKKIYKFVTVSYKPLIRSEIQILHQEYLKNYNNIL